MSTRLDQLTDEAMSLTPRERVELAERMWESVDAVNSESVSASELAAANEALRRAADLTSGRDPGATHEEVMADLGRAVGCD